MSEKMPESSPAPIESGDNEALPKIDDGFSESINDANFEVIELEKGEKRTISDNFNNLKVVVPKGAFVAIGGQGEILKLELQEGSRGYGLYNDAVKPNNIGHIIITRPLTDSQLKELFSQQEGPAPEAPTPTREVVDRFNEVAKDIGIEPVEGIPLRPEDTHYLEEISLENDEQATAIEDRESRIAAELADYLPEDVDAQEVRESAPEVSNYKISILGRLRSAILGDRPDKSKFQPGRAKEVAPDIIRRAKETHSRGSVESLAKVAKSEYAREKRILKDRFWALKEAFRGHGHTPSQIERVKRAMQSPSWDDLIKAQEHLYIPKDSKKEAREGVKKVAEDLRLITIAQIQEELDSKINAILDVENDNSFKKAKDLIDEYVQKRIDAGNANQEKARTFIKNSLKAKFLGLDQEDPEQKLQSERLAILISSLFNEVKIKVNRPKENKRDES